MSPCLTRRLCLTTRLIRALPSSRSSSANTIRTVSFRILPRTRTVSPRKSCRVSIVLLERAMTELSSLTASVTLYVRDIGQRLLSPINPRGMHSTTPTYINVLGFFFFLRIAVEVSSSCGQLSVSAGNHRDVWLVCTSLFSLPEGSLISISTPSNMSLSGQASHILEIDPLLIVSVVWLRSHLDGRDRSSSCNVDSTGIMTEN